MTTLGLPSAALQEEERILNLPMRVPQERDQSSVSRDAAYYSAATGRSYNELVDMVNNHWDVTIRNEAQTVATQELNQAVSETIDLDSEEAGETIGNIVAELREIDSLSRFLPPSLEAAVRSNAPGSRAMALDRVAKLQYAGDQFQQVMNDFGWNRETVLDFAEVLVDPLSITRVPIYRRLTQEFESLLSPNVSPEQFEEGIQNIIQEAMDAGWMSEENRVHFATFLDFLSSGIYSPEARAEEALGWMDIGFSAAGALGTVRRASNGVLRGSTALTTGTVSRGPSGSVVDAARNDIHGLSQLHPSARRDEAIESRTTEAVLLSELEAAGTTSTSILTPSTLRHSFYSSAEHAAIRALEMTSRAFDLFRGTARDVGSAIDMQAFEAFRSGYRANRIREQTALGNTRIIDTDVGLDDFDNIFSIDVLGKADGTPFSNTPTGERAARAVMREGDDLMQNTDGTFVILRRNNIGPRDLRWLDEHGNTQDFAGLALYRATDPEQLGYGLWARIGSPLAQADPETSSYLYRAESVMNRTMSSLNRERIRVMRGMRARQIAEVYDAFEVMAQSDRTAAMTRQQFIDWFTGRSGGGGRAPTEAQVNLYLLEQARLDAQLFINADVIYKRAVQQNAVVANLNDQNFVVRSVERNQIPDGDVIYDPSEGRLVSRSDLPEGEVIYENMGSLGLPMNALYVRGQSITTRAVRHSDFFIRNAGGHRGYVLNAMQFLVKQNNTRTYAGGIIRAEAPTTLLGARTAEEATIAANQVNNIIDAIAAAIPVRGRSADEFLNALETTRRNPQIDSVIAANRTWNPEIENLTDLVKFARDRGLDLRTRFQVVEEGAPLEDLYSGNSLYVPPNATHGDQVRMSLSTSGRGQGPLPLFGGGTVPMRSSEEMLQGSFARTVAQAAESAYAMRAFQGLKRAAKEAGVLTAEAGTLERLPIRTQIKRMLEGNMILKTAPNKIGERLELDLRRLDFRLSQESHATRIWRAITRSLANALYGKGFKNLAGRVDRWSTDPVSALRGFAFDAYLGFFNPSQLLMQSVQVINIMGIAGMRGIQGAAMYPVMRFALANGNPEVIMRTGKLLERVTGLKAEQFADMVEMFQRSGRNITDMNLAEMTATEANASAVATTSRRDFVRMMGAGFRNFREAGRIPFKEGDLVARITAFNTAYIRAVEKFGQRTSKNAQDFQNFITWEEQRLTQGMTAASRQAYEQLPFMQFMTYQLRINEALFAGTFTKSKSVLTREERLRLAFTHALFFGAMASTGTAYLSQWYFHDNQVELPEPMLRAFQRGLLDAALSEITGSETAASSRFASSMGAFNIAQGLSNEGLLFFTGPGIQFGTEFTKTTFGVLVQGLHAIATGETTGFEAELNSFVRLTSTGNYAYNAITALKYGEFLTRRNQLITDDLTEVSDVVFTAFGIPLEEVAAVYEFMGQERFRNDWLRSHANRITEMHRLARMAAERDDVEAFRDFYTSISDAMNMLEPFERDIVERMIGSTNALDDELMVRLIQRQSQYLEQTTREFE